MTKRQARSAALLVAAVVAAALVAGCGGSDDAAGTTDTQTTPSGLKVGLITDLGQLNDDGFNELAYNGLKRAERELGVQGRVLEAKSAADYVPNMTTLARQGYDLVIGVGYAQGDAVATAAQRFPEVNFAIVDVDQASLKGAPPNVQGLLFREEQVGYLVGYLGALTAKRGRRQHDQRRRRLQGAPGRSLHRRIPGRCNRRRARDQGEVGLLAGLGRPGEVQGARAQPDRRRLHRRLPGRGRLRPRCALRRQGREGLGHRRRRRPVVPRPPRPDERAQGRRQRRLPHDRGGRERDLHGWRQRDVRHRPGGRRSRQDEPEGERGRHRGGRGGRRRSSPRARSPTSRPRSRRRVRGGPGRT